MNKLDMFASISAITGELRGQLLDLSADNVTLPRDTGTLTVMLLEELDRLLEIDRGRGSQR